MPKIRRSIKWKHYQSNFGFNNFPMDELGATAPKLKAKAEKINYLLFMWLRTGRAVLEFYRNQKLTTEEVSFKYQD
ncbi:hypothetical protein [Persicitalea jodogahamensis]|nr:hypothetical protein [Persicitalea jodogahamensis]